MVECPLCVSTNNEIDSAINVVDLKKLYNTILGIEIDLLLDQKEIYKIRCHDCDLIFFYPQIVADDKFYSIINKSIEYYPSEKDEYKYALRFISNESYLLEIGCGTGEFAKLTNTKNYVGLEINQDAVRIAKKRGLNVLKQTICEHAKKINKQYDIVCAFQVLEHIPNLNEFVSDCLSCLRRDGKLIFSVPSADSFLMYNQNHLLNLPPHHQTWWTDTTLYNLQEIFNIKLIDIYHEKVQDIHLRPYVQILYSEILRKFISCKMQLLSTKFSIKRKIINKLSSYLCDKTFDIFRNDYFRGRGHTVSAVYKKI